MVASHLLQMRGLKHAEGRCKEMDQESHLLQMRGLKLKQKISESHRKMSHLLQMRGLKLPTFIKKDGEDFVASFTDAWIETWTGIYKDRPL